MADSNNLLATIMPQPDERIRELFQKVMDICAQYVVDNSSRDTKVVEFRTPEQMHKELNLKLDINAKGYGLDEMVNEINRVVKFCVRTGHPRFMNQLWSGYDLAGMLGDVVSAVVNASTYTYEVAPHFSMMEMELCDALRRKIGWESGDGIMTPGGALANLYAFLCARAAVIPDVRHKGNQSKPLVCFASRQCHYTLKRSAFISGLGFDNAVYVDVDEDTGRMNAGALDAAITAAKEAGKTPFFVQATSGTTVPGAFDPLDAIADVCEKHGVWLHVDACWGGNVLFSAKYRHLVAGIERANSVAWCLHKGLTLPQQTSFILTRGENTLKNTNASNADYLFHPHDETPYDLGDKTLNCGRRQDAFKAWLAWKVHGDLGWGARIDLVMSNRDYVVSKIKERQARDGSFFLIYEPEYLNTCFWYLPESVRGLDKNSPEFFEAMTRITPAIRRAMQIEGKTLCNYQPLDDKPNFFRLITTNAHTTHEDIDFLLETIERHGKDLK